jgi:NAD(P)-dependent dehydrogenase (short-subunit alcohol dehydrogenase family)
MKVAIVTAGGSGMGAAAARRLAQDGYKIAILSSSGKGEVIAKELGGIGVTGSNQSVDDLKRLVDTAMSAWARIDVLVNSAGHGPRDQILKITDQQWLKGMDTYLLNVIRPTRLVTPIMIQQRRGAIINISTAWAFEPSPMFPIQGWTGRVRQDFCRPVRGRQCEDEQRPSRMDRQPAGNRRAPKISSHAAVRHKRGDRSHDFFPRL